MVLSVCTDFCRCIAERSDVGSGDVGALLGSCGKEILCDFASSLDSPSEYLGRQGHHVH